MNSKLNKLLLGAVILVCFQNCSKDVDFNRASSVADAPINGAGDDNIIDLDGPEDEDIAIIHRKCNNSSHQTATITLSFPRPNQTCDFGNNGNLPRRDLYLTARIEQKKNLNLPVGAIICDANFTFVRQPWLYDDHFLLLFNRSVIASSYNFSLGNTLEKKNFGLLEYDWSRIAGMVWNTNHETVYCPSIPGGNSTCSFPGTDINGVIELDYDSQFIKSIMSNGVPLNHSFTVVSVGDNDDFDCEHSDLEFTVQVSYVK